MNPILTFLAVLGACALLLGLFIVAVTWAAARLDRAENAASGFQRHQPYTEITETDSSALKGDFPPSPIAIPKQADRRAR